MAAAAFATLVLNIVPAFAYVLAYSVYEKATHQVPVAIDSRFPSIQLLIAQLVAYVPLALFLLAVLPRLAGVSFAELGVRRPTIRDVAIGLAGTAAMWVAVVGVGSICAALTHRHDTEPAVALLSNLKSPIELGIFLLVACVFAPIVEELTFRVLIFNAFTKYASIAVAAIASGVLFGAEHVISTPPEQLITVALPLACGGVVLAYVYATTRCFWSNVTTHACFNGINVIALVVFHAS